MRKNFYRLIPILTVLLMFLTMVANAQQQVDIDMDEILRNLAPRTGELLILDILLYLIFGLAFISMLLVSDKQLLPSLIMVSVALLAVVAKVEVFGPLDFAIFVINVGMFVGPLVVAGMVRSVKVGQRPPAMIPAILTGLLGGGYFFMFWALRQQ